MDQSRNFISCDLKMPHTHNQCSLINANTTDADCNVMNDAHYATRGALPAEAHAIMNAAGPRHAS